MTRLRARSGCGAGAPRRCLRGEQGYLTVFLALSVMAFLGLFLLLIRETGRGTARLKTACGAGTAADSVLAEFHRELHERFDLFYVDTQYLGEAAGSPAQAVGGQLEYYIKKNLENTAGKKLCALQVQEVEVTGMRMATDQGAASLREQVYAYMSADPAGEWAAAALVTVDRWKGFETDTLEWTRRREDNRRKLEEDLRKGEERQEKEREEQPESGSGEGEGAPQEAEEENLARKILAAMEDFMEAPILHQVYGRHAEFSAAAYPVGELLSHRPLYAGNGPVPTNSHGYPQADELLFDEYVLEKTGDFLHEARQDAPLRYQTEYILGGKDSDRKNLEAVAEQLMLLRGGVNCACLFGDTKRTAKAETVAGAISLVLFQPHLKESLAAAILFVWSYYESVVDVRTLLKGGKIPLVKTPETWQTPLSDLLKPWDKARVSTAEEGFDYRGYLRGLLYLEGSRTKSLRMMDIMEMEIRQTPQGSGFRMDRCMDLYSFRARIGCGTGEPFQVEMTVGYD